MSDYKIFSADSHVSEPGDLWVQRIDKEFQFRAPPIDRRERNRSKFVLQAVEHELERRRREELRSSLASPHPESEKLADLGLDEWTRQVIAGDDDLLEPGAGSEVRWTPGEGWAEVDK